MGDPAFLNEYYFFKYSRGAATGENNLGEGHMFQAQSELFGVTRNEEGEDR